MGLKLFRDELVRSREDMRLHLILNAPPVDNGWYFQASEANNVTFAARAAAWSIAYADAVLAQLDAEAP